MKKFYTAFVTIFWFAMMGFLFNKEVLPAFIISNPAGYKLEVTKDVPLRESWMGIYFKDKKIGFSNTVIRQDIDSGAAGYRINETALLKLNILGEDRFIRIKGSSFFTENYNLKNFNYKIISGDYRMEIQGAVTGSIIKIKINTGAGKTERTLALKNNMLISNSISPMLLFKKLDTSRELEFEVFDPITMGTNRVAVRRIGSGVAESSGVKYETDIFEIDCYGIKTRTWATKDGEILKEESGMGFTMQKENAEDAMDIAALAEKTGHDLLSEFSIASNIQIQSPRDVNYLRIEKNDSTMEITRDKEPDLSKALAIPIQDIPEEAFIQSKDEGIIRLANQIVGPEKNSWSAARKILRWVYVNIRKTPTLSIPSALDVLATREGDCNEHTALFTAISRSIGIPTKMIAGLVYLDGAFYYHAWPQVYVGEWVDMDPTLGQEIADATHIPLVEGGIKKQLELIRIIGQLKIRVVEYK